MRAERVIRLRTFRVEAGPQGHGTRSLYVSLGNRVKMQSLLQPNMT